MSIAPFRQVTPAVPVAESVPLAPSADKPGRRGWARSVSRGVAASAVAAVSLSGIAAQRAQAGTDPVVGVASAAVGAWDVTAAGTVTAFGGAPRFGSRAATASGGLVVGMAATADGRGYWLVASDGGVFSFGDAQFHGSLGGTRGAAVSGMSTARGGDGYTLITTSGVAHAFGNVPTAPVPGASRPGRPVPPNPPVPPTPVPLPRPAPLHVGMLEATSPYYSVERSSGFDVVTINAGWSDAEPQPGVFDQGYLASLVTQIKTARAAGFEVDIDPGIQYAPAWAFDLPGGARFVDQYGDVFSGPADSGNQIPNGVTDPAVRSAIGTYLATLGHSIPAGLLTAVRGGGGPTGELRYPDASYAGRTDCYWAYDASTQARTPTPGWVPGTGSAAQAISFLNSYNTNLAGYGAWLDGALHTDFATTVLVMLPGWGQRPGVAAAEERSLLTIPYDEFNMGLDWPAELAALPDRSTSVAYTTYLDAPSADPSTSDEDPADYLASVAGGYGMALGGENTGNGAASALALSLARTRALHYVIFNWMDQGQVVATGAGTDPGGPGFPSFTTALRT